MEIDGATALDKASCIALPSFAWALPHYHLRYRYDENVAYTYTVDNEISNIMEMRNYDKERI